MGEMVIGGGADGYNNFTQRGSFQHIEETVALVVISIISRLKKTAVGWYCRYDWR